MSSATTRGEGSRGRLSRRKAKDKLSKKARRSIDKAARASGFEYVADRMDILRSARGYLEEIECEDYDIMSLVLVAEFLAGDRTEG